MSLAKYFSYKISKWREDSKRAFLDLRKPSSWWYMMVGFFVFYFYKWITTFNLFWLMMMSLTFLVIFGITVWLDYRNSPWRKFYIEKLVLAEKKSLQPVSTESERSSSETKGGKDVE